MPICTKCSVELDDERPFCWKCGSRVTSYNSHLKTSKNNINSKGENSKKSSNSQIAVVIDNSKKLLSTRLAIKQILLTLFICFAIDTIALAIILLGIEQLGYYYSYGYVVPAVSSFFLILLLAGLFAGIIQIWISEIHLSTFSASTEKKIKLIYLIVPLIHFFVLIAIDTLLANSIVVNYTLTSLIIFEGVAGLFYLAHRINIYLETKIDSDYNLSKDALLTEQEKIEKQEYKIKQDREKTLDIIEFVNGKVW